MTVCTTLFEDTSRASAAAVGWADYPIIYAAHPISSVPDAELRARGAALVGDAERLLLAVPSPVARG